MLRCRSIRDPECIMQSAWSRPLRIAISNASTTSSVRIWSAIAYPITSRVAQSISEAKYNQPCHVLM